MNSYGFSFHELCACVCVGGSSLSSAPQQLSAPRERSQEPALLSGLLDEMGTPGLECSWLLTYNLLCLLGPALTARGLGEGGPGTPQPSYSQCVAWDNWGHLFFSLLQH